MTAVNAVVDLAIEDGIAVVTIDYPPVNALSPAVMEGLYEAMVQALADPAAQTVVLACAGRTFIAGADLKSLGKVKPKVDFFELQARIEDAAKPTVAAIHGAALGGGLETALTFHYRIAAPSARMGLPEVTLGLLPGGGGTQRLTRIVGAQAALDLLVSGRQVGAKEALSLGLIDALADEGDLRGSAVAFARSVVGSPPKRVRDLDTHIARDRADPGLFDRFRAEHAEALRGLDAPAAIVRCVEAAATLDFDAGLAVERAEFQPLLNGPQSAALRHLFAAERAAAKVVDAPPGMIAPPLRAIASAGPRTGIETTDDVAAADLILGEGKGRDDAVIALDPDAPGFAARAAGLPHPHRAAGLKLYGSGLIEIVRTPHTSPETVLALAGLAKALRRPVVISVGGPSLGAQLAGADLTAAVDIGRRLVESGAAYRASDIDMVCTAGLGWPRHEGGPMFQAALAEAAASA